MTVSALWKSRRLEILSTAWGIAYGLSIRGLIYLQGRFPNTFIVPIWVMSIAFIMVLPFCMGYLTIAAQARNARVGWARRIFQPWVTVLLALLGCEVVGWEGTICIVMMAPIALLFGTLGGVTAGVLLRPAQPRAAVLSMAAITVLPFLLAPVEHYLPSPAEIRGVESAVVIEAPPQDIWRNIERVRPIDSNELPHAWTRDIGFPKPLEATLSHEGIGGVRHATFAGHVLFIETIDIWEPEKRLGFSIRADTREIPPHTLDDHVTVGGQYFDVLHGEYVLEPIDARRTRLRLVSDHRLSTDFNWYARLWTDAVMLDVQKSILYVIKNRCEYDHRG